MHREWLPTIALILAVVLFVGVLALANSMDHTRNPDQDPGTVPTIGTSATLPTETNGTEPVETTEPTEGTEPVETIEPTDATEPTEATEPVETTEPTEETEPVETTEPTEATEPVETTEPTEATEPVEPTEPTETTEPTDPTDSTQPEETTPPEIQEPTEPSEPVELLTYEEYMALSPEEQQAYFLSFEDPADYMAWFNQAKAEYEANKDDIVIGGDGNVDIGDILGGGG